ncbi:MAG: hypothetical protein ACLR2K_05105 [Paraclostridium sordellii]
MTKNKSTLRQQLRPFVRKGYLWAKIISIEESNSKEEGINYSITLDVLNDKMKERDNELIEMCNKKTYIFDDEKKEYDVKMFLKRYLYLSFMKIDVKNKEVFEHLSSLKNEWFKLRIVNIDYFERTLGDLSLVIGKEDTLSEIYREVIQKNNSVKSCNNNWVLKSEWYFSASPIVSKQYLIEILNTNSNNNIPKPLEIPPESIFTSKQELENYIEPMNNYYADRIRVNHIGQGHCSMLFNKNEESIFFDIGGTLNYKKDISNKVDNNDIDIDNCRMIIISHWDMDHYLGLTMFQYDKLIKKLWLAPNVAKSQMSKRLINILYIIFKRPFLVPNDIEVFKLGLNLHIYRNKVSSDKDINNNGLVLFANKDFDDNKHLKLVSVGDVEYDTLHKDFENNKEVDLLVVSHHGSKKYRENPFVAKNNNSCSIVPVGYNTHNHPTDEAIQDLKNNGFKVFRTDGVSEDLKCKYGCRKKRCEKSCDLKSNKKYIEVKIDRR